MCKEEFEQTVYFGRASFLRKTKWFSSNLDWIKIRVQDGKFNNSAFAKDRYTHICQFEADISKADWVSTNEIQFSSRRNPSIKFLKEINYG